MFSEETICAIATPQGEGGIGIIRISGERSREILGGIFRGKEKDSPSGTAEIKPRELTYGHIVDPETREVLDEVLAVYMPAPKTYTREDVVEINCHGGLIPLRKVLRLIIRKGARLAQPGEFTKRAFLNGRIDLVQAEAVADIIGAKSEAAQEAAMNQLRGRFSEEIESLRAELVDALVDIDVNIDYPDEDIEELTYEELKRALSSSLEKIEKLISGAERGRILKEGVKVAIIGRPNVGKSSLMNGLLREERAIVTEIPGTTRDTIEEYALIDGIPFNFTDTAGIRATSDPVEKLGIERSIKSKDAAELVILMVDGSLPLSPEDREMVESLEEGKGILIINKQDKPQAFSPAELGELKVPILSLSVKSEEGIAAVERALSENIEGRAGFGRDNSLLVTGERHLSMLENAATALREGIEAADRKEPLEIVEIDVRKAYEELGFITGDSVQDDVIEEVFKRFCLGK